MSSAGEARRASLTILVAGCITAEDLGALPDRTGAVEVIDLGVDRRADLRQHAAEINRAIGAASSDWILFVRGHESVPPELATEIAEAIREPAKAWGYRIRVDVWYAGAPLGIAGDEEGEIRLLHRRHGRFDLKRNELKIEGTVVRLKKTFRSTTFETAEAHRAHLESIGRRVSVVAHVIRFVFSGGLIAGRNARRYLWLEAGYRTDGGRLARPN